MRGIILATMLMTLAGAAVRASTNNLGHYVRVSPRDSRYFELDNGQPYIPIGLNLVSPLKGEMAIMADWCAKLAAQGGNFARIRLDSAFFEIEHAKSGEYDAEKAKRTDEMLALARKHGLRVKLCIDGFRHIHETDAKKFGKPIHHVANGGLATNMTDWVNSPACRQRHKGKYDFLANRYGSDPIIFGWELWNEMNCVAGGDVRDWTKEMLAELHRRFPKNLCMQSLGSFDSNSQRPIYRDICQMPGNDVAQIHRYLDLGASLKVCHGPVDVLAAEAIREVRGYRTNKPILLAESGGVEWQHSGPWKYYDQDTEGMILHDVLFAPFFAGAAGPGHFWHRDYVAKHDLWWHFGRFAQAVADLDPPAEAFEVQKLDHPRLRIYVLRGKRTTLAWCRDKEATWQTVQVEGRKPETLHGLTVTLPAPVDGGAAVTVSAYDPWTGEKNILKAAPAGITLPDFSRSLVVRLRAE
ncbi:MAG: hypothetical protein PCFJNLEI_00556 [Verrucomicrobiae bacterium]|nr:hypothetical protein [Verrucomicrobiae bacterium]